MKKALILVVVGVAAVLLLIEVIGYGTKSASSSSTRVVVGSANFPENALLADIYAGALDAKGVSTDTTLNLGSREVLFPAMKAGDIALVPEYSGSLLTYLSKGKSTATEVPEQVHELDAALPHGLELLEPSAAQDRETITCTGTVARKYHLTSLEDLAPVSGKLVLGAPPEFPRRGGFGTEGLKRTYGIEFADFRPLDTAGPLTVAALQDGKIDCANLFSTQSAITTHDFVSLSDPKHLIQSEAVLPLISTTAATPHVTRTLNAVSASLTTDALKAMVAKVEVDKQDPGDVAADFLATHHLD